jgi:hypothetical protein
MRQYSCLELIASENFTSKAVMEAMGSCLCNKYSRDTQVKDIMEEMSILMELKFCANKELLPLSASTKRNGVLMFSLYQDHQLTWLCTLLFCNQETELWVFHLPMEVI